MQDNSINYDILLLNPLGGKIILLLLTRKQIKILLINIIIINIIYIYTCI